MQRGPETKKSESVSTNIWTICKVRGQEKFRMVSQGHITHCLRCQGDSVLIFMSIMGSLGTNMSGKEHRQGDMSATSSNLERSEARWFRSRIQAGWGRDWGLAGDTFTSVGQGLETKLSCSAQNQVACSCLRVSLLPSLREHFGEFPHKIWGKRFSWAANTWWVIPWLKTKLQPLGKGSSLEPRSPRLGQ